MRTIVYVDGFNLYYGAVRGTPYKWLDISRMTDLLLPRELHRVAAIRYYTAIVSARTSSPDGPKKQAVYLRALKTIPGLTITLGHFQVQERRMKRAGAEGFVNVIRTDEKGSDVNLATDLLIDAYERRVECAVVVSNDSDLLAPMKHVRALGVKVGLLNPHAVPAKQLKRNVDFYKSIRKGVLEQSQFPAHVESAEGTIMKPDGW